MANFIDRDRERAALQREYERSSASFVVMYGRRRVGKTTLLAEFIKDKHALYFLATEESEAQNRAAFKNAVAEFTDDSLLRNATVDRWEDLFDRLTASSMPGGERLVLVLDEFQYLGKANAAFPSVMQRIWDTTLKNRNVMLVVCGSLISMMVDQTLSYASPLYGRRTAQMKMGQLPFSCYREFFPGKDRRALIEFYSVTGGVPKYIELFDGAGDIYKAIERNVLDTSSFLYDEPQFLLQKEVGDVGSYFSIIKAIAAGNRKLGNIAAALEVKQTSLTKYLKVLSDLDVLEREVPVTEDNPQKSKKGLYRLKDNFLLFWFKFVFPNLGLIESGHPEKVMETIRVNFLDSQAAFVYEDVCRDHMWQLSADDVWPFSLQKVGRWWGVGDVEIDVLGLDDQGRNAVFAECKFWKGSVGLNVLRSLEQKAARVPWHKGDRADWYVLFSIAGFTDELRAEAASREDLLLVEG